MYRVNLDGETVSTHETLVEAVLTAEEMDRQEEAKGDYGRMVYVYLDYPSKRYLLRFLGSWGKRHEGYNDMGR